MGEARFERYAPIHTQSLEEATSINSQLNACAISSERLDWGIPFAFTGKSFQLGALQIVLHEYGASVRAGSEHVGDRYAVSVPRVGRLRGLYRGTDAVVEPGTAFIASPSDAGAAFTVESGYRSVQLFVEVRTVAEMFETLVGTRLIGRLEFEPVIALGDDRAAGFTRLLDHVAAEAELPSSLLAAELLGTRMVELLVTSLLSQVRHTHTPLLRRPSKPGSPLHVRRTEEFIAANAHGPITLRDLVTASGVPARTLTAAFRAHRGCSPMAFLRERRYELARQRLLTSARSTVAEIALACGFEHLGRFSVGYRKRFGEMPKVTLARNG